MGELDPYISKAVATLRGAPNLSDFDIYRKLVSEGVERPLAARLIEFVPNGILPPPAGEIGSSICRVLSASDGGWSLPKTITSSLSPFGSLQ
jgi:hypothetical protein